MRPRSLRLEHFPTILNDRHRLGGDHCTAGRFRAGTALLVRPNALVLLSPRAPSAKLRTGLSQTKIAAVPTIQPDRKSL